MMSKAEFVALFEAALQEAASNAERLLGHEVPSTHCIHLHGLGHAGTVLDPLECANTLFIDGVRFYAIIDISVVEVSSRCLTTFVRVSGRPPVPFENTWNTPPGSGPFHQLLAKTIKEST